MTTCHTVEDAEQVGFANVTTFVAGQQGSGTWQKVPKQLLQMARLESLSIHWQAPGLELPRGIGALTHLRSLDIAGRVRFPPEIGQLRNLREFKLEHSSTEPVLLPDEMTQLELERLHISAIDWPSALDIIRRIRVSQNVTLLRGDGFAAEDLERADLSAWSQLKELELDVAREVRPTILARKLPNCGFCLNPIEEPSRPDWL